MSILITGGAGYIGSHTAAELLSRGESVVYLDNLQKGHRGAVLGGKFYEGDLRDDAFLTKVFKENEIEAVIHFAADSLVGESVKDPLKYYNNNIVSTLSLLNKMAEFGALKLVFSSTAATYGEPVNIPILEDDPTVPTNPYGETKLAIERLLRWVDAARGIKYVSLRYFNAAGADPDGRLGEDHTPETHLIPIVLEAAMGKRPHVGIFGEDYPTEDGTCIRDYVHVTDLAQAHLLSLDSLRAGGESRTFNLGNGRGFSVKEVIDAAREVTGANFLSKSLPRREGDPAVLVASSEKIVSALGWRPKFAELKTIIETAWSWHSANPNGYED